MRTCTYLELTEQEERSDPSAFATRSNDAMTRCPTAAPSTRWSARLVGEKARNGG